jgi:hypothetical protein
VKHHEWENSSRMGSWPPACRRHEREESLRAEAIHWGRRGGNNISVSESEETRAEDLHLPRWRRRGRAIGMGSGRGCAWCLTPEKKMGAHGAHRGHCAHPRALPMIYLHLTNCLPAHLVLGSLGSASPSRAAPLPLGSLRWAPGRT